MTPSEFSIQFDVLYNNITSNQAPGLNEYEKSVFLTKAQNELVKNYFLYQSNPKQAGFEGNPRRQINFSKLVVTRDILLEDQADENIEFKTDQRSILIHLADEDPIEHTSVPFRVVAIVNENIIVAWTDAETEDTVTENIQVTPITLDEYHRLMSKPYKYPVKGQAWRLLKKSGDSAAVELILPYIHREKSGTYILTYIRYPQPIILQSLTSYGADLKIDGISSQTPCELDDTIHEEILQRAVELAKTAWLGDLNAALQIGQRSE